MNRGALSKNKRVALVETDTVQVTSSFDMLVTTILDRIKKYEVEEDKLLLRKLFSTSKAVDRNLIDITNTSILKSRLEFIVIDLIQRGQVIFYNKSTKSYEDEVQMAYYHHQWSTGVKVMTGNKKLIMNVRTGSFSSLRLSQFCCNTAPGDSKSTSDRFPEVTLQSPTIHFLNCGAVSWLMVT